MHPIVYLPNATTQDPAQLEAVGLGDFVERACFYASDVGTPTGEAGGMFVGWPTPAAPSMRYNADAQTWQPAIAVNDLPLGRYWIGFANDAPPTPTELQRAYPYRGKRFTLGDSNEWLFPKVRELPHDMIRADDGTWVFETQRRFHAFVIECDRWYELFAAENADKSFRLSDAAEFCELALRLNYRLTAEIVNHCRLFDTENVASPMLATIGAADDAERAAAS